MSLNRFNQRAAMRIAAVSIVLACIVAPFAWLIATESAEEEVVALAMEESQRFLHHFNAIDLVGADAAVHAQEAARTITGGIFDIAEIYGQSGLKIAEAATEEGDQIESMLPRHGNPVYTKSSYESLQLPDKRWVLRVFIPLRDRDAGASAPITGYFEGVRVVPEWQSEHIQNSAFGSALLAGLGALFCGAFIYPIVVRLSADNERKAREVLDSHISMMEALGRAIAKRDSDTGAHNYRVAWIAARIGEALGMSGSSMQALIAGSFLHDVGKIGIPDAILLKPGRLDNTEMETMRTHVGLGEEIVRGMGWLDGAHEVVAAHHEKWDGSGYPRRLAGETIPVAARIFAIADVFDALSSKRPYKDPMPFEQVMSALRKDAGGHFDPDIFAVFENMAGEIREILQESSETTARTLLEARIRMHFAMQV
jgi:HD-GYP domain-containing protein (c-di-GMP phosphodiesterase class II)